MASYKTVLYEKKRKGVLITLNRPEALNALSRELQDELSAALTEADADPEIRAVVLTGAGRAFSAGYDMGGGGEGGERKPVVWPYGMAEGSNIGARLDTQRANVRRETDNLLQIWEMGKPVIAAVNGWCMGGGSWHALVCHMTYAADNAVFAQPEVRMSSNSSFFWILSAGFKNGLRYALTGDHIDAQEALRIGLVNKVVPQDRLLEECFQVVDRIAHISPDTIKINLQVATKGLEMMGLRNAIMMNNELSAMAMMSKREEFQRPLDEAREKGGLRSYLAVRDGPFQPEPFGPRSKPR
ncbi:MAG: enoyl-CoA hydratase/isomerase family protein [Dehalococcoidia bacterium]|nr:enoyl-CoA hydratase/isomerase family protein [Dehalococcoidia bacterium]